MERHDIYVVGVVEEDHIMLDIKNVQLVDMVSQVKFTAILGILKQSTG